MDYSKIEKEIITEMLEKIDSFPPHPNNVISAKEIKEMVITVSAEVCKKFLEKSKTSHSKS